MAKQSEQYDPLPNTLLELGDTPSSYAGQGGKILVINAAGDGLEFTDRIVVSPASPHLTFGGDLRLNGWAAIHSAPITNRLLSLTPNMTGWAASDISIIYAAPTGIVPSNKNLRALSLSAIPTIASGTTSPEVKGVLAYLIPMAVGGITDLTAIEGGLGTIAGSGAIPNASIFKAAQSYTWSGSKPTTFSLFNAPVDLGNAAIATVYGLRIVNQTGIVSRLLELGPATPYLRLEGGAAPSGNDSKLVLNFGGTLYRLTRDPATGAVQTAAL